MLDLIKKYLGPGTTVVILTTLGLFIVALFVKGFTRDLLLEAAVFLVSVKLIILSYRNSKGVEAIQDKLEIILSEEKRLEKMLITIKKSQAGEPSSGRKKEIPQNINSSFDQQIFRLSRGATHDSNVRFWPLLPHKSAQLMPAFGM
jgi:hypothetical protein